MDVPRQRVGVKVKSFIFIPENSSSEPFPRHILKAIARGDAVCDGGGAPSQQALRGAGLFRHLLWWMKCSLDLAG